MFKDGLEHHYNKALGYVSNIAYGSGGGYKPNAAGGGGLEKTNGVTPT